MKRSVQGHRASNPNGREQGSDFKSFPPVTYPSGSGLSRIMLDTPDPAEAGEQSPLHQPPGCTSLPAEQGPAPRPGCARRRVDLCTCKHSRLGGSAAPSSLPARPPARRAKAPPRQPAELPSCGPGRPARIASPARPGRRTPAPGAPRQRPPPSLRCVRLPLLPPPRARTRRPAPPRPAKRGPRSDRAPAQLAAAA